MGKAKKKTLTIEARQVTASWFAVSECFAYAHPVNDRIYKVSLDGHGATEADARADCQAKIDYFVADRGDTIVKIGKFVWQHGEDDGLSDVQAYDEPGRPSA